MISLLSDMFKWIARHSVIFAVRIATLLGATWAVTGLVHRELDYRIEYGPMFLIAVCTIATLRVWMPWSSDNDRKKDA